MGQPEQLAPSSQALTNAGVAGGRAGADEIMGDLGRIESEGLLASLPSPLAAAGSL